MMRALRTRAEVPVAPATGNDALKACRRSRPPVRAQRDPARTARRAAFRPAAGAPAGDGARGPRGRAVVRLGTAGRDPSAAPDAIVAAAPRTRSAGARGTAPRCHTDPRTPGVDAALAHPRDRNTEVRALVHIP
ncbi:MAG: hypothetical protein D6689_09080 [Deltaproteobacteria bacterium]|nr:MAG: hypothetical protein D6689_09080 [Deltaproteobacteria bacterium]